MKSPRFGVGVGEYKSKTINSKIERVTACHFGDSTSFLMLNAVEDELAFGAQRTDQILMHQVKQVEYKVRPGQQVVGVYGYLVKQELEIMWRFSFILNNDFQ